MVQHALRDFEPPDHATGKPLDEVVCKRHQFHGAQRVLDARTHLAERNIVETRREQQVLPGGQRAVSRQQLRDVADMAAHIRWLPRDIEARDPCRAGTRRQERREHLDDGALASTIGPISPNISPGATAKLTSSTAV